MSDEGESLTTFTCYYGGKFEKIDGQVIYVGGQIRFIDTEPSRLFAALMNQLPISLYGQRIWYKMPYEGQEDRKEMLNGDANYLKMCSTAMWVKAVDIFVEPDSAGYESDVNDQEANHEARVPRNQISGHVIDEARESRSEHCRRFDEEERVERIVGTFVDEEGDEYNTPAESDGEEDDMGYFKYQKGSGEFKLRQVFDSLPDFKRAVLDYVLKHKWNIKYVRWEKDKSELKCATEPEEGKEECQWKIYCAYEAPLQKWMVKTYRKHHTCVVTRFSKILTEDVIAKLFINDLRDNPRFMPKDIQRGIEKRWDLVASIDQCRKAKKRALDMIEKEHDEQFSRLRDYHLELLDSNPGSTVDLETYPGDEGEDIFFRFYVCFAALKKTWCAYCRPIFGLDGCFLKFTIKGQLLAAVGRDANNQMYPISWAVVDVENEDNWKWFIQSLQTDLNLRDGAGFTVISDRQKGLLNVVSQFLPKVEHRMCARHIYVNLKKKHPNRAEMKGLFWKVAKSYNLAHYRKRLDKMKAYDLAVYDSMLLKNPENCSLAYFNAAASCDDVSNNISESFNNAIDTARSMPMVEMLETIRRRAMLRIEARSRKATKHRGRFSLNSILKMSLEQKKVINCKAYSSGGGVFEVKEKNSGFKVYMHTHSCTCWRWDLSGLPCRHALKVISDGRLNPENFISDWYLTSKWRNMYGSNIQLVHGVNFWKRSDEPKILPPPTQLKEGRHTIPKRIKEKNESPKKKKKTTMERDSSLTKVSREKRIIHCGNCGWTGHNARKCQNVVVNVHRPPKKKKTQQDGEGSSQQVQSQVID